MQYLLSSEFYLEILSRLLGYSSAEVELVDLAVFVPHGRLVMHHEFPSLGYYGVIATASIRFDLASF